MRNINLFTYNSYDNVSLLFLVYSSKLKCNTVIYFTKFLFLLQHFLNLMIDLFLVCHIITKTNISTPLRLVSVICTCIHKYYIPTPITGIKLKTSYFLLDILIQSFLYLRIIIIQSKT